ncbi:hypothetical protein CIK73_11815 [Brachybacterium alimentarium]|nr:hypothetical protein CIK73_11815 [Brachybacterium alimentarium]
MVEHFVDHGSAASLPEPLRKKIAKEFSQQGQAERMWTLAGDGWKNVLRSRLDAFKIERDRGLNTPKPGPILELFRDHAGYPDITAHWKWPRTSVPEAKQRLKEFVELRGSIAHRVESLETMTKREVRKSIRLVKHLVEETDKAMTAHARAVSGTPLVADTGGEVKGAAKLPGARASRA